MKLDVVAAEYALGLIPSDDLGDLAVAALLDGVDSANLAQLAGAERCTTAADRRDLFIAALRECAIHLPTRIEAAQLLKRHYAREALAERMTAADAAERIVRLYFMLDSELPKDKRNKGDSFGIAKLISLYWSLRDAQDSYPPPDRAVDIERQLFDECAVLAAEDTPA